MDASLYNVQYKSCIVVFYSVDMYQVFFASLAFVDIRFIWNDTKCYCCFYLVSSNLVLKAFALVMIHTTLVPLLFFFSALKYNHDLRKQSPTTKVEWFGICAIYKTYPWSFMIAAISLIVNAINPTCDRFLSCSP